MHPQASPYGPGRVLVADDDEVIRRLVSVNLELEGFTVEHAVDGRDCIETVARTLPDLVTLDILMPGLDGWSVAQRLRRDPRTAGVRIVMLSAQAQTSDLQRARGLGVDAYITKPFDPEELIAVVRQLVGVARGLHGAA